MLMPWNAAATGTPSAPDTSILPTGAAPKALVENHFPSRMHHFIFTNWTVVPTDRIAAVLETTPENVARVAQSMGLPASLKIPPEMATRGYITILRRNWHLLPYDQLLTLLGMTPQQLAFSLREDDFLYIKLGSLKPQCDFLHWNEPTPEQNVISEKIAARIAEEFDESLAHPDSSEPRFAFLESLRHITRTSAEIEAKIASRPTDIGSPRFLYSYVATFGDPLIDAESLENLCPDGYLEQLALVGVDGIWLHVVLRQLAPGGEFADVPEFGEGHETRIAALRKLVEKTNRYGIRLYLYMNEPRAMPVEFYEKHPEICGVQEGGFCAMCTSDPEGKTLRWLEDSLAYLFAEVPGLGGIFTITGSENLTFCASHGQWKKCSQCEASSDDDLIIHVNTAMARGVHRSAPDAAVIVWDWGWKNHGLSPSIIERLPADVQFMSVSEWALPIERGGVISTIGEYSLSAVGPGPRALAQWETAGRHGLPTVAKVQLNCTWELAAVPYLPVVDLVAEHCHRLGSSGVTGMMIGWSLGGYPSPNLETAYQFALTPSATEAEVLNRVAESRFGSDAARMARKAWSRMSEAYHEYPYGAGLYTAPTQMGPANRFYQKPTGYTATMVGIPYDDIRSWCGQYPPETSVSQFEKVASGWNEGISLLRDAVATTDAAHRQMAESELRFAEVAGIHFASVARQIRFVLLRDALVESCYPVDRKLTDVQLAVMPENVVRMRQELRKIIEEEMEDTKRLYIISSVDSRIGFEASNHYFYIPQDLVEKIISCHSILEMCNE